MSKSNKTSQKAKSIPSVKEPLADVDFFSEQPVESLTDMLDREQIEAAERARAESQEGSLKLSRYDYHDIHSAPRNGTLIIVSGTGADEGVGVFWKRTRAFANATHRWEETGFFVNIITNMRVDFEPRYWRNRGMYEV